MKDRSANPEVLMADELVARILSEDAIRSRFRGGYNVPWRNSVSQNHPPMWLALLWLRYLTGGEGDLAHVLALWRTAFSMCSDLGQGGGWMGTEMGSRKYGGLTTCSWLVAASLPGFEEDAREWLRYAVAMCELSSTHGGRVLLTGQRSSSSHGIVFWDGLLAAARGLSPARVRKLARAGSWKRRSDDVEERTRAWDWGALERLSYLVPKDVPRGLDAVEVLRRSTFKLRTVQEWLHRHDGAIVATWTRDTINGMTAPIVLGHVVGGVVKFLPEDKVAVRRNTRAACQLVGSELVAVVDGVETRVRIPPGRYVHTMSDGWTQRVVTF